VRNATSEKHELQAQLRETITSYTEAIEKLHQQLNKAGPDAALQWKLHDTKATNSKMQLEIADVMQQMADEFPDGLGQYGDDAKKAEATAEEEALKVEVEQLRKNITALAGDAVNNVQIDNSRAAELTRLRRDVDTLTDVNNGLNRNLKDAETEKQNLIDNFLNVKKDLDNLQIASLNSAAANPEMERHLTSLRIKHDEALSERNRVAAQIESIDRDRENQKQQQEAALERVMAQNAKLLEERDRMDKEKNRVSGLYQATMGAMGAGPETAAPSASDDGTVESVEDLKERLRQKKELLTKREEESESLRSRLRKLAMV